MMHVVSRELEGIDDGFSLRLGQFDGRHPFCIRNCLGRNGPPPAVAANAR
jgi:hypothetical protein